MGSRFDPVQCAMCGKLYIPTAGTIYKLIFVSKSYQFCSYGCYRAAKKVKDDTNESQYRRLYEAVKKENNCK